MKQPVRGIASPVLHRHTCGLGLRTLLAAFFLLGGAAPISAYTYRQIGVASNFLVDEGRVYFVQADGSMTVLELETGTVLVRKQGHYGGTLLRTANGILMLGYPEISLLDKTTLEPIWRTNHRDAPTVVDDRLISYDGNGLVECRNLATGAVLWSYDLPGALEIVVKKGRVLVLRSARYDGPERLPAVVLLDLQTGRELLHKTTPPGIQYLTAYFDGERIYLQAGKFTGSYSPNTTRFDEGRPSARFERMVVWDLDGNEIESYPRPAAGNQRDPWREDGFELAGRVFARGEVFESMDAVPPRSPGSGRVLSSGVSSDDYRAVEITRFGIDGGALAITATSGGEIQRDGEWPRSPTVGLKTDQHEWRGRIPYLAGQGAIVVVGSTPERVLLGSNYGHVECLDTADGRSRWIYLFPTVRGTMSYSSPHGMPPYMADAAAIYRRDNANRTAESGTIIDGAAERSEPRIVLDPAPSDPFRDLPLYAAIAWTGGILAPATAGLLLRAWTRRHWDARLLASLHLALAGLALTCFLFYGRVSVSSSMALRGGILVSLVGALGYSIGSVKGGHWFVGAGLLLVSMATGLFVLSIFLVL